MNTIHRRTMGLIVSNAEKWLLGLWIVDVNREIKATWCHYIKKKFTKNSLKFRQQQLHFEKYILVWLNHQRLNL